MSVRRARRIKIRIVAEGKRIWIPGIPFKFLRFAWMVARPFIRNSDPDTKSIKKLDVSGILDEIAGCGGFVLADIDVRKDNTKVLIEIK